MDRDVTDFDALKKMSLVDFLARSVLLRDVTDATRVEILDWCEKTYVVAEYPSMTAYETQHGKWTMRGSFEGENAVKNAALFRMFWD